MTTLAPKLPWTHPFAGGYPRIGGQPLPTDPDAIDYLERVKAADGGAAVEVGVAMAVDAFVKGCKADSAGYAGDPTRTVWDALQACCIMCGARTVSGALVPLKGTAPTPYNFASGDYDRSSGLKGNASTKWIGTNRPGTADDQNDVHMSAYMTAPAPIVVGGSSRYLMGSTDSGNTNAILQLSSLSEYFQSSPSGSVAISGTAATAGFRGMSRTSSTALAARSAGTANSGTVTSVPRSPYQVGVYASAYGVASATGLLDARLAFYSIGSAIPDLAALDNRVTALVNGIKFHSLTGLVATDYDPDTVAYIVAAYEAGGTL